MWVVCVCVCVCVFACTHMFCPLKFLVDEFVDVNCWRKVRITPGGGLLLGEA